MLVIAGMGLYGLRDISLGLLDYLRQADRVYIELYTSIVPDLDLGRLEKLVERRVEVVRREELEGAWLNELLEEARSKLVVLLAPGDPFIATTHMAVKLEAKRRGVEVGTLPSPSFVNAISAATGLDFYKFCRPVTVVRPKREYFPTTPYHVLYSNLARGLHTIFLLEFDADSEYAMDAREAVEVLKTLEEREGRGIVGEDTLFIAVARASCPNEVVKAFRLGEELDLGPPPHTVIVPGLLNPVEVEALQILAGASQESVEKWVRRVRALSVDLDCISNLVER